MDWINVKDGFPAHDAAIDVLAFDGKKIYLCGRVISEPNPSEPDQKEVKFYDVVSLKFIEATHWIPLPEPPK